MVRAMLALVAMVATVSPLSSPIFEEAVMQFLTRPDGTVPPDALVPPGARLTRPTAQPAPPAHHMMRDLGDGEQIGGVWYQRWTAVVVPVVVPAEVSPIKARRALRAVGILPVVEAALAQAGPQAQETWEYAITIPRNEPMLLSIAGQLGMTSAELDAIFILAEGL
jgi:hypothetical protein